MWKILAKPEIMWKINSLLYSRIKIKAMKVGKKQSIWDNSNILLNGTNIKSLDKITFKDGDKIDLLPRSSRRLKKRRYT
jgi:molybdopterin converting factor small subunit